MHIRFGKHTATCVLIFCLTQLSGCSFTKDASAAKSNTQKLETSAFKNKTNSDKSYTIKGKRYYVLNEAKGYHKQGVASWYGKKFHGKRTSSNERFNLYGMTAASPVLPLHSYIKVTNLQNGKQVLVKVNDRGPFKYDRILDLSYAAAKKLGFASKGLAMVDIEVVDPAKWKKLQSELTPTSIGKNGSKYLSEDHKTKKSTKKSTTLYAQNKASKDKQHKT